MRFSDTIDISLGRLFLRQAKPATHPRETQNFSQLPITHPSKSRKDEDFQLTQMHFRGRSENPSSNLELQGSQ